MKTKTSHTPGPESTAFSGWTGSESRAYRIGFIDGWYGNKCYPGYYMDGGRIFNAFEVGDIRRLEYKDGYYDGKSREVGKSSKEARAAIAKATGEKQ